MANEKRNLEIRNEMMAWRGLFDFHVFYVVFRKGSEFRRERDNIRIQLGQKKE